ncbi:AAA family ATPase [uncultured Photobacterium sp.]|uniref:SPOR domain-containing protein n=1 Tax=uncultured Photobacterium sp. TaxID=173973 RepID=UPI00262BDE08|nr:AAA family ATPase [uncultured Photobacterium sp.]
MTRDMQVAMLDLDSQIQLLSRIQFLTRFSSNLVQISGREGAGKTWLAQRYLEQWAGNSNQALLLCHPSQTDSQHRSIILKQLAAKAVFNEQDPLQQSVERFFVGDRINLLLVVDDAHLLSAALIAELWALVQKAQTQPGWQINVLLFSQSGRLDKCLSRVSHGQGLAPLELDITDLTAQEVQTFVEVIFASDRLDAQERRSLKDKAVASLPTPGALMQLQQMEPTNMAGSSSRKISPMALLVVLLTLVAAGASYLFFSGDEPAELATDQSESEQGLEILPEPVLSTGRFDEQALQEPTELPESVSQDKPVSDDTQLLLPPVSKEGLTVGRSDDSQRVVVPSDVVDAMLTEQEQGGTGEQAIAMRPDVDAALTEVLEEAAEPESSPAPVQSTPREEPEVIAPVATIPQPTVRSRVPGVELKTIDRRHYALQLAALKSMSAANQFITEYEIAQIATIYETRRNDEPWFIIITGDYPDMISARKAETRLPQKLQSVQPWVKSYAQIHREIDRVK